MRELVRFWIVVIVKFLQIYFIDPILWVIFSTTTLHGPRDKEFLFGEGACEGKPFYRQQPKENILLFLHYVLRQQSRFKMKVPGVARLQHSILWPNADCHASHVLGIQSSRGTSDLTSPIFFTSCQLLFGRYNASKFERFR